MCNYGHHLGDITDGVNNLNSCGNSTIVRFSLPCDVGQQ